MALHVDSSQYLFPSGACFGEDNLVLHARATRHVVEDFSGPLSIKTVMRGQVGWTVEGRALVIHPHTFLILHDGERYSMSIDETHPVETCCIFFRRGYVEGIVQDMTTPLVDSLDSPDRTAPHLFFPARLHVDAGGFRQRVWSLALRYQEELQPSGLDEDLITLSVTLVSLQEQLAAQIERVPAAKAATRTELFRRLQVAREYVHGHASEPVSLADVAREAHVSPYHLHRVFTRVYGVTLHRYITRLKLQRAYELLQHGRSVTESALEVGFSSVSSFSRLFRGHFGVPPSQVAGNSQDRISPQRQGAL